MGTCLDKQVPTVYNSLNCIGQFVTILSVNKTREPMGTLCPFFVCWMDAECVHFCCINHGIATALRASQ